MIGTKTIENVLHITPSISSDMINAIELWGAMYENKAPWLKEPTEEDPSCVKSLGLPQFIASEKARTALLEFKSDITGVNSIRADFLNNQYSKVKKQLRRQLEYGIAKGGLVIKPYVVINNSNSPLNNKKLDKFTMEFDYVQADDFYPLAFNGNGDLTEAAFIQRKIDKGTVYTRVEYHKFENRSVIVKNLAFKASNSQSVSSKFDTGLGTPIALIDVPEWANLQEEVVIENVDRLMFAYFRMPEANTIDTYSPLGVSGFDKAIGLIEDADNQYSRLLWEFEGGELAIDVDRDALKDEPIRDSNGNIIHHSTLGTLQQRLYRRVDLGNDSTYNVFSPQLRDVSLINGLNNILMRIEDVTGLSRGTISDASTSVEKTATELKILKQRSYQTNHSIQTSLQDTLDDLIYVMDVYCDLYNITPKGEYEVSYEWDDSILVDVDTELHTRLELFDRKIISDVEMRMWYLGETEEQAIEALSKVEQTEDTTENTTNQEELNNKAEEIEEITEENVQNEQKTE